MSVQETSETSSFRPPIQDSSTGPDTVPLPQPDELKAALDTEIAMHDAFLTLVGDCRRQITRLFTSFDPAFCDLCRILDRAHRAANESKIRQSTLRMRLRLLSGPQRLERVTSGLGLAVQRILEARNESLRMELAASARSFDSVAHRARVVVRRVASLCEWMVGQGARIRRVWSEVWEKFRPDLVDEQKEDEETLGGTEGRKKRRRQKRRANHTTTSR